MYIRSYLLYVMHVRTVHSYITINFFELLSLGKVIFSQEPLKVMIIIVHYYLGPWLKQILLHMEFVTEVHSMI